MQSKDQHSLQSAKFIVSACSQDNELKPQIVKPILDIINNGEFYIKEIVLADLTLLKQNLSVTDIMALNWFVKITNKRTCQFEDFIKALSEQSKSSFAEIKEWLIGHIREDASFSKTPFIPKTIKNQYSVKIAESIVKQCLDNPNTKTLPFKPYFELDIHSNFSLKGFTEANHFLYNDLSMNQYDVYYLNWFISTDCETFCHFQDFIDAAKKYGYKFNIHNLKL